jgi:hypothetical protein
MRPAVAGGSGAERVDGVGRREGGYRIDAGQAARPGQLIAGELIARELVGCERIALQRATGQLAIRELVSRELVSGERGVLDRRGAG